jgi:hypothetical protein
LIGNKGEKKMLTDETKQILKTFGAIATMYAVILGIAYMFMG